MKQNGWPQNLVAGIAAEVRRRRLMVRPKISAQQLSDRCAELGFPVARNTVSNLENGRKDAITVTDLVAIGAALRVPWLLLLYPVGQAQRVEVLPGVEVEPLHGLLWASGLFEHRADEDVPRSPDGVPDVDDEPLRLIALYRNHESAVRGWEDIRAASPDSASLFAAAGAVAMFRSVIAAAGHPLPELPAELAAELASPVHAAGVRAARAALVDYAKRQGLGGAR